MHHHYVLRLSLSLSLSANSRVSVLDISILALNKFINTLIHVCTKLKFIVYARMHELQKHKKKTRKTIYDKSKTTRACAKILGGRSDLVTYYIIFRYGCRLRDPAKHNGQGDAKQYAHQADDFTV